MKKVTFIVHGKLQRKDKIRQELESLLSEFELIFVETTGQGDGIQLAQKALECGTNYLIVLGGDGSVNELVNGIMAAPEDQRTSLIAGVIPLGTGNDFARTLKLSKDPKDLVQLIKSNQTMSVDVGKVEFQGVSGRTETRYFVNIADVGIGGHVVMNIAKGKKWMSGNLTYFLAIVKAFFSYEPQQVSFQSFDYNYNGPVLGLFIANCCACGSGLFIAPDADPTDGLLDFIVFGKVSLWDYLKNVSKIKKAQKLDHPEVFHASGPTCKVTTTGLPLDIDGEFLGHSPLKIELVPRAIAFLSAAKFRESSR